MRNILVFICILSCCRLCGTTYFVAPNGNNSYDGLSWDTPKQSIQAAIAAASAGDSVFVSIGVYVKGFAMKEGVNVYGGFLGTEQYLSDRIAMLYGENEAGSSLIFPNNTTDTCIVQRTDFSIPAVADGFVLRYGKVGTLLQTNGTLSNVIIRNQYVGGRINGGILHNALVTANQSSSSAFLCCGLVIEKGEINNCRISNNTGTITGGIHVNATGDVHIRNSEIFNNRTYMNVNYGIHTGGIHVGSSNYGTYIVNCKIVNNYGYSSLGDATGGISAFGQTKIRGCLIANNQAAKTSSSSSYYGYGGIYTAFFANEIINSTIVNNLGGDGAYTRGNSWNGIVKNCIFWHNKRADIFHNFYTNDASIVTYSAIQGGFTGSGSTNINLDSLNSGDNEDLFYPLFTNPATVIGRSTDEAEINAILNASYQLDSLSACVDRGTLFSPLLGLQSTDIYGNERSCGEKLDIGAAEFCSTTASLQEQEIIWEQALSAQLGDPAISLTAYSTSGLPVTYTSSNWSVATINGNLLYAIGAGDATITASQPGNSDYFPAQNVEKTVSVRVGTTERSEQEIIWEQELSAQFGDPAISLTAYSTSGLPITYTSSNWSVAAINGNLLYATGAGDAIITASQPGNNNYFPAQNVEKTVSVRVGIAERSAQEIIWEQELSAQFCDPAISLTAYSTSGLPITYTSSNWSVAAINGNLLYTTGAGDATITASQPGNNDYFPAQNVEKTVSVRVGIAELIEKEITIYPNPFEDVLYIDTENQIDKIEIFSVTGERVFQPLKTGKNSINLPNLKPGIYFIVLNVQDKIFRQKLVKI
ncbi:MAG: T9SS type A sorting domain-containing protein [Bacteroidales bacterium]|nr:T9SS type A sorting domain-containing protein [Bacteroidales bacterium]